MHLCRTGRHAWLSPEDAAKCCDPAWRRVLAVGDRGPLPPDATHRGTVAGTPYGFQWLRVANTSDADPTHNVTLSEAV